MSAPIFLVEQIAPALYIFIAVGVFRYWRRWRQARYAYRATSFELERSIFRYRSGGAVTAIVLLVEIGLMVMGIQRVVAPTLREDQAMREIIDSFRQQPIDRPLTTPTRPASLSTLPIDASGHDLGIPVTIPTATSIPPTPAGTIVPGAPIASGCDTPYADLQIPTNGMRVFQTTPIVGTAYQENFLVYKLELSGVGTGNQFVILGEGTIPVTQMGILWQFDPVGYEPGEYRFRLTVFDTTTTMRAHCEITIYID